MTSFHEDVETVLAQLENVDLPHPSGPLLSSFVTEAVDPTSAARYVSTRMLAGETRSAVSDWAFIVESITEKGRRPSSPDAVIQHNITRRDGNMCCITGKAGTRKDPLLVTPILPLPTGWTANQDHITDMLGAFFGPRYRDWWLSYARNPESMSHYCNHWLVRTSAAKAYARGLVKLDRMQPSMVEYHVNPVYIGPEDPVEVDGPYALLGDHSRTGIQKVDPRFVGTHARLCKSIRYVEIAREIAPEILYPSSSSPDRQATLRPSKPASGRTPSSPSSFFSSGILLSVWLMFPSRLRMVAYDVLRNVGERLYGKPNDYSTVQRLPFGLYLKYQGDPAGFRNEFNALQTARRHTSVPVPRPLDVVVKKSKSDGPFSSQAYLLITRLPGVPLSRYQDVLSDRDCEHIAAQLRDYLAQLRDIPRPTSADPDLPICDTLGSACRDPRIRSGDPVGPFPDETAFNQVLRFPDDPARRGHKIVFTHADLNPRNILIDRVTDGDAGGGWRVTGIVDWENAGWYPEYWDYTKALFEGFRWTRRYVRMVKGVFAGLGDYSKELVVETRSWESGDGI